MKLLHQGAGLALSRHHHGHSSHARQGGGAHLWGHSEWRWHLRLSACSPAGDGDHRAPQDLWRTTVCSGGTLEFARRCASDVVTGKSLQRAGFSRPQLVGVDDRAVWSRCGGIRVAEVWLVGVSGARTGGYGGQCAILRHYVWAGVTLCPWHSLRCLSVLPTAQRQKQRKQKVIQKRKGGTPWISWIQVLGTSDFSNKHFIIILIRSI